MMASSNEENISELDFKQKWRPHKPLEWVIKEQKYNQTKISITSVNESFKVYAFVNR